MRRVEVAMLSFMAIVLPRRGEGVTVIFVHELLSHHDSMILLFGKRDNDTRRLRDCIFDFCCIRCADKGIEVGIFDLSQPLTELLLDALRLGRRHGLGSLMAKMHSLEIPQIYTVQFTSFDVRRE